MRALALVALLIPALAFGAAPKTKTQTPTATPTPKPFVSGYYAELRISDNGIEAHWFYRDTAGRVPQGAEGRISRGAAESQADFIKRIKAEVKEAVAKRPAFWDDDLNAANAPTPRITPTPFQLKAYSD